MATFKTFERIFKKLDKLTGGIEAFTAKGAGHHVKLQSGGFMDLTVEVIGPDTIALSHWYEQNGDLCPDPTMEVRIIPGNKMAEALNMQDYFGFRVVYPEPGKVYPSEKHGQNDFLDKWLTNLRKQGFYR